MAITYDRINSTTLSSTATDITFSSIPSSYTDLIIVCNFKIVAGGDLVLNIQLNGDTGSNYSQVYIAGVPAAAAAAGSTLNSSYIDAGYFGSNAGNFSTSTTHFFSYSNTSHNKSTITTMASQNGGQVTTYVNLWRSNSAINSIKVFSASSKTYAIGSMFTLYGILAA
jgi:hypothetical protein